MGPSNDLPCAQLTDIPFSYLPVRDGGDTSPPRILAISLRPPKTPATLRQRGTQVTTAQVGEDTEQATKHSARPLDGDEGGHEGEDSHRTSRLSLPEVAGNARITRGCLTLASGSDRGRVFILSYWVTGWAYEGGLGTDLAPGQEA